MDLLPLQSKSTNKDHSNPVDKLLLNGIQTHQHVKNERNGAFLVNKQPDASSTKGILQHVYFRLPQTAFSGSLHSLLCASKDWTPIYFQSTFTH
jgi:hypothetical protein